jgi:hypothetical protein
MTSCEWEKTFSSLPWAKDALLAYASWLEEGGADGSWARLLAALGVSPYQPLADGRRYDGCELYYWTSTFNRHHPKSGLPQVLFAQMLDDPEAGHGRDKYWRAYRTPWRALLAVADSWNSPPLTEWARLLFHLFRTAEIRP